jgi:hypothetical protein
MANIYQNSMTTLAATGSYDAYSGLLNNHLDTADKGVSPLTGNLGHKGTFIAMSRHQKNILHSLQGRSELLTRRWVMQERLLSPRVLHFHHELVMEKPVREPSPTTISQTEQTRRQAGAESEAVKDTVSWHAKQ